MEVGEQFEQMLRGKAWNTRAGSYKFVAYLPGNRKSAFPRLLIQAYL